jgi:hypothetical protein
MSLESALVLVLLGALVVAFIMGKRKARKNFTDARSEAFAQGKASVDLQNHIDVHVGDTIANTVDGVGISRRDSILHHISEGVDAHFASLDSHPAYGAIEPAEWDPPLITRISSAIDGTDGIESVDVEYVLRTSGTDGVRDVSAGGDVVGDAHAHYRSARAAHPSAVKAHSDDF